MLTYVQAYNKGWRASTTADSMDAAEGRFEARYGTNKDQWNAWMDGYLDQAAGREKWHLRECRANGGCAEHTF
jgi:hypothetical protein